MGNGFGILDGSYKRIRKRSRAEIFKPSEGITLGFVIDTADPQQMGRVKAICAGLGDASNPTIEDINNLPWISYCSPFGGLITGNQRGPDKNQNKDSSTSYGFWSPPSIGSQVFVMCIDGDISRRIYIGSSFAHHTTSSLPQGRFSTQIGDGNFDGPYSATDNPIEPLFSNLKTSFVDPSSPEWFSRASDFTAAALDNQNVTEALSEIADDKNATITLSDGSTKFIRQGYDQNLNPDYGNRFDNHVHSWTTPGLHSIAMDDRPHRCRTRIRTTTGHQILLDDTNERIYISTSKGNNWVEMDTEGNIDIFSSLKVSVHAASDINLTAGNPDTGAKGDVRILADNIHLTAREQIRASSSESIHIYSQTDVRIKSNSAMKLESGSTLDMLSSSAMKITSNSTMDINSSAALTISTTDSFSLLSSSLNIQSLSSLDINAGASLSLQSGAILGILGGGSVLITGPTIHMNGPPAPPANTSNPADTASSADQISSNLVSRIPLHEPWPRMSAKRSTLDISTTGATSTFELEWDKTSLNVNKIDDGNTFKRNNFWTR